MSQEWIELGPPQTLAPVTKNIKGNLVTVYVSPHAVPRAVRGTFDRSAGIFRIEFRYLDGCDPTLAPPQISKDGTVSIFVGKSSGRIERMDVHANPSAPGVGVQIIVEQAERMLAQVQSSDPSLSRRLNAKAAKFAVENSFSFFSLTPAM
jgi:hypothetical protein